MHLIEQKIISWEKKKGITKSTEHQCIFKKGSPPKLTKPRKRSTISTNGTTGKQLLNCWLGAGIFRRKWWLKPGFMACFSSDLCGSSVIWTKIEEANQSGIITMMGIQQSKLCKITSQICNKLLKIIMIRTHKNRIQGQNWNRRSNKSTNKKVFVIYSKIFLICYIHSR